MMFTTFGHLKEKYIDTKQLLESYPVTIATAHHHALPNCVLGEKKKQKKAKQKHLLRRKRIGKDVIKYRLFIYFPRMILCLYCFQVLYSHAREARVVYSQTAKVTKLFVILPLGLMLKLVSDMLSIANICYNNINSIITIVVLLSLGNTKRKNNEQTIFT